MRYKLLLILLILPIAPQERPSTVYYFPHIQRTVNAGVAWYNHFGNQDHADLVNAYYWYNEVSHEYLDTRPQAIPMVREMNKASVLAAVPGDYNRYMLVGNEGEERNQDNLTPEAMADFILEIRAAYPLARLVCLNSYDIDYMLAVIGLLPAGVCEVLGVHVGSWVTGDLASHLDRLCTDCLIWITELSWPNNDLRAYDHMYELTQQAISDPRVANVFGYTTTEAVPARLNFIDEGSGRLRPNGLGFSEALEAYPCC